MYIGYDFYCSACNLTTFDLVEKNDINPSCSKCGLYTEKQIFNNTTVKSSADYKVVYKTINSSKMADKIDAEKKNKINTTIRR
jgi:hypothetical protein